MDERRNIWVERWQKGIDREESFHQIFRQYYRLVRSFFARRSRSEEEIEDLVQETFFRVHRNLDHFRGESKFETWLFQVSANVYKNTVRSQTTQKRDAQEVSWDELATSSATGEDAAVFREVRENGPLDDLLQGERSHILHRAMQELPPQMRRCVELRVSQDMKYREIAALMGVSIDTVKAHLFQARQLLKKRLGDYFAETGFAETRFADH
ncbi:MAG TPA: sigma-70 family RNA polymerase sigma factor [Thermoanaerobaculia bacterium]|nr:sigma-70 family RNA polymerase sigma factor [Thermoanaerobaculia bacterium]